MYTAKPLGLLAERVEAWNQWRHQTEETIQSKWLTGNCLNLQFLGAISSIHTMDEKPPTQTRGRGFFDDGSI